MEMSEAHERPAGVTLLAIAAAVIGGLALFGALEWSSASYVLLFFPRISGLARLVAGVLVVVGVLQLSLAYGAWLLRPWAWTLGVIVEIVALVLAVLQLGRGVVGSHLITIVLASITLWYLARSETRAAFGRRL
jgi:uncharacterized membrane protein (DUF2068 family)